MDRCFPDRFDLCSDAVYFIGQYRGKPKYAVYPFYSPCVLSAVLTISGEPLKASLGKEMSVKKGAVLITKRYTARDDFKLNTHGDLKIRVFGLYEWVFVRVILQFIAFLIKLIA